MRRSNGSHGSGVTLRSERSGVALPRPVELLDARDIVRAVPRVHPDAVHVRFAVDSTNTVLAERLRAGAFTPELCTAEIQTAGRGRQGRRWVSGLGRSLVLSVSWRFTVRSSAANGLSLAIGVALAEALAAGGFERVMLKWPNDLVVDERKLAGILVEASHPPGTDSPACVIGVGFNVDLDTGDAGRIDRAWTDFARAFGRTPRRSWLASQAANAILDACDRFRDDGLAPFLERWGARDALHGRLVRVLSGRATIEGVARGIDGGRRIACRARRGHRTLRGRRGQRARSRGLNGGSRRRHGSRSWPHRVGNPGPAARR